MLLIVFLLELTVVILFFVYTDKVSQILHFSFLSSPFLSPFLSSEVVLHLNEKQTDLKTEEGKCITKKSPSIE